MNFININFNIFIKQPKWFQIYGLSYIYALIFIEKVDLHRQGEIKKAPPSAGLLPKHQQWLKVSHSEARSQELVPGLPCKCSVPSI